MNAEGSLTPLTCHFVESTKKSQKWTEISEQVHMPVTFLDLKGFKVI